MPSTDGSEPSPADSPFHEKLDPELVNRLFVEALDNAPQCTECHRRNGHKMDCSVWRTRMITIRDSMLESERARRTTYLTDAERDAIADGEPYCFRCNRPASSFHTYQVMSADGFGNENAAEYVRTDEGTYNPDTNRFACDECYIAIGTPSAPGGWRAP